MTNQDNQVKRWRPFNTRDFSVDEIIKEFDEFNGSYYVSTPVPLNKRLPLSFLDFVDVAANLRSDNEISFK